MPGGNAINRRRVEFQSVKRRATAKSRQRRNDYERRLREPMAITPHQRRQLLANPKANLKLSSKKLRRMMHEAKMVSHLIQLPENPRCDISIPIKYP
jgi:hypothetical protein